MRGSQRGFVLWSLLATPACGLVVGFEPRELCEDCADSTMAASGSGGSNSGAGGASSTAAGSAEGLSSSSAVAGTTGAPGGSESDAGGAGGTDIGIGGTSLEDTTGGGAGTGSGSGGDGGGTGGSSTDSDTTANGGTGGETASGGSGASTGGGGSGGAGSGGGGSGGAGSGGASSGGVGGGGAGSGGGGGAGMTITTSTSTTIGGNGGTGPSLCEVERSFDATDNVGSYPAALRLGRNNSSRPWDFTWVEDNDVYASARSSAGSVVLSPKLIDGSGTHSASAIVTEGQYAHVAYGEFASGTARLVMYRLNPLAPEDVLQDDTGALDGDAAPRVVGVALRGSSSDALVAAVDANGDGLLALFSNGEYVTSQSVTGQLDDLVPVDLGESFAIAYIQDDSLQISLVPYDLSEVGTADEVEDVEPIAPTLGSLRAASTNDGAALVWLESNGVHWVSVDADGDLTEPALVSSGSHVLPAVDALGDRLFASWIDTSTGTLYLRRLLGGSTGSTEPFRVAEGVVDVSYGFAADPFSTTPTLGFVYSTDRLRMTIVTCLD